MMGKRPPVTVAGGDDVVSSWRRLLCYTQRPGVTDKIKRNIRRSERHEASRAIRRGQGS